MACPKLLGGTAPATDPAAAPGWPRRAAPLNEATFLPRWSDTREGGGGGAESVFRRFGGVFWCAVAVSATRVIV